jgi:hypothetical protein
MSTALGIAAVTATLESLLNSVFNPGAGLGSVTISALAPDLVQASMDAGGAGNQLNLFLHQVTPNAAWRNAGMPSLGSDGKTALHNPPLALDLHYLLTAYTPEDGFAEALLGHALLLLHQYPTLARNQITAALGALPASHPLHTALQTAGLADQLELLKITPDTLGREEMAWIWTALKADYRPTYAFQVSVVLLQPAAAVSSPLPVLSRNITVQPGPPPVLFEVQLAPMRAGAALGDTVTLAGEALGGVTKIALTNQRFGSRYQPDVVPSGAGATQVSFVVPNDPANLLVGLYTVKALVTDAGGNVVQGTNGLTLAIAPAVVMAPPPVVTNTAAGTSVALHCTPDARPAQVIALAMGGTAAPPQPFGANTSSLTFMFPAPGLPAGPYVIRLQVDGVDSAVSWSTSPPQFTAPIVMVP